MILLNNRKINTIFVSGLDQSNLFVTVNRLLRSMSHLPRSDVFKVPVSKTTLCKRSQSGNLCKSNDGNAHAHKVKYIYIYNIRISNFYNANMGSIIVGSCSNISSINTCSRYKLSQRNTTPPFIKIKRHQITRVLLTLTRAGTD